MDEDTATLARFLVLETDAEGHVADIYAQRIRKIFDLAGLDPCEWTRSMVSHAYDLLKVIEEERGSHSIPVPRSQRVILRDRHGENPARNA